ncbi:hypothetical protein D9M72_501130 [compost metagenome]
MCSQCINGIRTPLAAGFRCSQHCLACPDHVVHDKNIRPFDVTCEQVARDDPTAATLFHDSELRLVAGDTLVILPQELRAFYAAGVRRQYQQSFGAGEVRNDLAIDFPSVQVHCCAAEGVLKRRQVVNVQRHDHIDARRLE